MRRGVALAVVLLLMLITTILVYTAVNVGTLDTMASNNEVTAARAFYAARSGVARAQAELEGNWGWAGTNETEMDDDTSYQVSVELAPWNRIWKITSTGRYRSAARTLVAYAELESFAKFAYFTDRDRSQSGETIWFVTGDQITGPTHTNGYFSISGAPAYSTTVTSANQDDPYYNAGTGTYRQGGQTYTDPARFYHYYTSYVRDRPTGLSEEFSFAGGHEEIVLPANTQEILNAALAAGTQVSPPANMHQVHPDWDYRITYNEENGRVEGFQGRPPGQSWRSVPEREAPPVYRLDFDSNGTVSVLKKRIGSSTAFDSTAVLTTEPIATIHVDGFVLVDGTVNGWVTLGCSRSMHNIADLVYRDVSGDALGIVVEDDFLVESPRNLRRDRTIHATIMTLNGSFFVDGWDQGSPRGVLHLLGGVIQSCRGAVGTFTTGVGGQIIIRTGYTKDYVYDQKLLSTAPLNFPSTGNVVLRSLIDQGAPGGVR